jgi:hypothetical protein
MRHCEKLAVVYGLMTLLEWMPIHLMKNLIKLIVDICCYQ